MSLKAQANEASNVKKVIAVISGKGGVGKSLVTSLRAVAAKRRACSPLFWTPT
jgi:Mrp family chromosome partitioning ATPase